MKPRKEGPIKQVRVSLVLDEATTQEFLAFIRREGFSDYQAAARMLIQYGLNESPKHFPRGVWSQAMYDVRSHVFGETSKFLYDFARQLGKAALEQKFELPQLEEGEAE